MRIPVGPAALSIFASASWGLGSVAQRRLGKPDSLVLATSLQMLVGGALIGLEALALGEWRAVDVHAIAVTSWLGFGWLVVFGSIAGYSAYLYTMQNASAALGSTYAYVNPIVAVGLGMLLFHERFTPSEALASAIIVAGIVLMMLPQRTPIRT
jgi:drug/metabolite transporter (DMT)-like permease